MMLSFSWIIDEEYVNTVFPRKSARGAHLKVDLRGEALIRGGRSFEGGAHLNVGVCGEALILIFRQMEKILSRQIKRTMNQSKTGVMIITNTMFYNSISILFLLYFYPDLLERTFTPDTKPRQHITTKVKDIALHNADELFIAWVINIAYAMLFWSSGVYLKC